jgi:hypothetical protein
MDGSTLAGHGAIYDQAFPDGRCTATGDFNGDGNPNLLLQNQDGSVAVWFLNGTSLSAGQYI